MATLQEHIELLEEELWRRGNLTFLLRDYQVPLYKALKGAITDESVLKYVLNCARRFGKSTVLLIIAFEFAIQNDNSLIKFVAPTGKQIREIVDELLRPLLITCPKKLKPKWNGMDSFYKFPNGSKIKLAGTDKGHAESLRGGASHLSMVDEAGFCDDLSYIIKSILMPTTLTTGGTILLASTPPKTPDHDFADITHDCKERGSYQEFDIYKNTSLTEHKIKLYAEESGGFDSTDFKREYLCIASESLVTVRDPNGNIKTLTIRELNNELSSNI